MYRLRLRLPPRQSAPFRHQDLLHDALVNGWTAAGIEGSEVTGFNARPWTFAPLSYRQDKLGKVHTLVVSTPDPVLAAALRRLDPAEVRYARASTGEMISFAGAEVIPEPDPIPPGEGMLGCLMLSPLVVKNRVSGGKRWIADLRSVDLGAVINHRLSRIAGRPVNLIAQADDLYLRANPKHDVLVSLKQMPNGRHAFVIGMMAPLVIAGSEDDLRLAWYAGIGEKTRSGFGCLGLMERGIGR